MTLTEIVLFNRQLNYLDYQELLQSSFNLFPPVVRLHLAYCFKEELTNEELEIQHVKFAAFGFIHVPDLLASG